MSTPYNSHRLNTSSHTSNDSYHHHYNSHHAVFKYKKKLPIKSLQAAICNVALFKNMKEKQFRDQIFISYCEDGVILESIDKQHWQMACDFVKDFLFDKKIAMLTYGFSKEEYEELISKGLKDYTRSMKQHNEECPYINIIHYQKLRKSCEYMDKEKYMDPLRYWQSKNKTNPNFAFLIVEPKDKFPQVKRFLLEVLMKREVTMSIEYFNLMQFLYIFCNSPMKEKVRELCDKKIIEACIVKRESIAVKQAPLIKEGSVQKSVTPQQQESMSLASFGENLSENRSLSKVSSVDNTEKSEIFSIFDITDNLQGFDYVIEVTNYSEIHMKEYEVKIIRQSKNISISKVGLEYIPCKEIEQHFRNMRNFLRVDLSGGLDDAGKNEESSAMAMSVQQAYEKLHKDLILTIENKKLQEKQSAESSDSALDDSNRGRNTLKAMKNFFNEDSGYLMIPHRKIEKQKCENMLCKLIKKSISILNKKNRNVEQLYEELQKFVICRMEDINDGLGIVSSQSLIDRNSESVNSWICGKDMGSEVIQTVDKNPIKKNSKNKASKKGSTTYKLKQNSQKEPTPKSHQKTTAEKQYHKVSIFDCPYTLVQYPFAEVEQDLDTFLLYLEQLKTYYCTYLIRFYGIAINHYKNDNSQNNGKSSIKSIYLIFDYHHRLMSNEIFENDLILDNLQIGSIILNILYLCQYLHTHEEPRCLGEIDLSRKGANRGSNGGIYWPFGMILPYLGGDHRGSGELKGDRGDDQTDGRLKEEKMVMVTIGDGFRMNCGDEGFEGDVKVIGKFMEFLMNFLQMDYSQNTAKNLKNSSGNNDNANNSDKIVNNVKSKKKKNDDQSKNQKRQSQSESDSSQQWYELENKSSKINLEMGEGRIMREDGFGDGQDVDGEQDQSKVDKELRRLIKEMVKESKYERITLMRTILELEEILCL